MAGPQWQPFTLPFQKTDSFAIHLFTKVLIHRPLDLLNKIIQLGILSDCS
jgi:hypothetical protein